jgi:hypothetical protein
MLPPNDHLPDNNLGGIAMGRNLILCADGTGNQGGHTPDSNVYKMYNLINIHDDGHEQLTYYDNGVGTSTNKIWRGLGGAFGFGFQQNVCDLYRFLAKNYREGDRIYLFGFSRGAATVRAFTGMVATCGLLKNEDKYGQPLNADALEDEVCEVLRAYKAKPATGKAEAIKRKGHGAVAIEFVGLWDTVSALGFPARTVVTGIFTRLFATLFALLDFISDKIWAHRFYRYELFPNILHAYQALAIDDARTSFWPLVWDERKRKPGTVEQVWFAGMHSNVGGGYERQGMANVPLAWMIERARHHGLVLKEESLQVVEDSNVHGRLYDSRDGLGIFYRYHPRNIEGLCQDKLLGPIGIHKTALTRMKFRTADYGPGNIPGNFDVTGTTLDVPHVALAPKGQEGWRVAKLAVQSNFYRRLTAYWILVLACLGMVVISARFWLWPPTHWGRSGLFGWIADIMTYVLPDFFNDAIEFLVVQNPYWFMGLLGAAGLYGLVLRHLSKKTARLGVRVRNLVMDCKYEAGS